MDNEIDSPEILIIDDEPDMCWALEKTLAPEGHGLMTVATGREALELIEKMPFKLVLLDAKLPDIDGIDLAKRIKDLASGVKVVMISGYYYEDDRNIQNGFQRGICDGFIAKPFQLGEVRQAVKKVLNTPAIHP